MGPAVVVALAAVLASQTSAVGSPPPPPAALPVSPGSAPGSAPSSASSSARAPSPLNPAGPATPAPAKSGEAHATVVILDDRATRDQAPARFLARAAEELARRKDIAVVKFSEARRRLDARANRALGGCGDDVGCLAAAARDAGGDIVVTVRLTKREGAFFLAVTRTNALRPQISDDEATLSGSEEDALRWLPEAIAELFADTEVAP